MRGNKKSLERFVALLLAVLMSVSLLPTMAFADEVPTGKNPVGGKMPGGTGSGEATFWNVTGYFMRFTLYEVVDDYWCNLSADDLSSKARRVGAPVNIYYDYDSTDINNVWWSTTDAIKYNMSATQDNRAAYGSASVYGWTKDSSDAGHTYAISGASFTSANGVSLSDILDVNSNNWSPNNIVDLIDTNSVYVNTPAIGQNVGSASAAFGSLLNYMSNGTVSTDAFMSVSFAPNGAIADVYGSVPNGKQFVGTKYRVVVEPGMLVKYNADYMGNMLEKMCDKHHLSDCGIEFGNYYGVTYRDAQALSAYAEYNCKKIMKHSGGGTSGRLQADNFGYRWYPKMIGLAGALADGSSQFYDALWDGAAEKFDLVVYHADNTKAAFKGVTADTVDKVLGGKWYADYGASGKSTNLYFNTFRNNSDAQGAFGMLIITPYSFDTTPPPGQAKFTLTKSVESTNSAYTNDGFGFKLSADGFSDNVTAKVIWGSNSRDWDLDLHADEFDYPVTLKNGESFTVEFTGVGADDNIQLTVTEKDSTSGTRYDSVYVLNGAEYAGDTHTFSIKSGDDISAEIKNKPVPYAVSVSKLLSGNFRSKPGKYGFDISFSGMMDDTVTYWVDRCSNDFGLTAIAETSPESFKLSELADGVFHIELASNSVYTYDTVYFMFSGVSGNITVNVSEADSYQTVNGRSVKDVTSFTSNTSSAVTYDTSVTYTYDGVNQLDIRCLNAYDGFGLSKDLTDKFFDEQADAGDVYWQFDGTVAFYKDNTYAEMNNALKPAYLSDGDNESLMAFIWRDGGSSEALKWRLSSTAGSNGYAIEIFGENEVGNYTPNTWTSDIRLKAGERIFFYGMDAYNSHWRVTFNEHGDVDGLYGTLGQFSPDDSAKFSVRAGLGWRSSREDAIETAFASQSLTWCGAAQYSNNLGPWLMFVNDVKLEKTAHLILDFNLPSASAWTDYKGIPGVYSLDGTIITDSTPVSCDVHYVGEDVTVMPHLRSDYGNTLLTVGEKVKVGSATIEDVGTVVVSFEFKGVYTAASGGTRVDELEFGSLNADGSWTYRIEHDDETVLYCQWNLIIEVPDSDIVITTPTPDIPTPGVPTPGTPAPTSVPVNPDNENYELHTVYFDRNYIGGGITSAQYGSWTMYDIYAQVEGEVSGTISDGNGSVSGGTWTNEAVIGTHVVTVLWSYPNVPTRLGWKFVGWSFNNDNPLDGTVVTDDAYSSDRGVNLKDSYVAERLSTLLPNNGIPVMDPDANDEGGNTFYAVWVPNGILWDANGGYFDYIDGKPSYFRWNSEIYSHNYIPILGSDDEKHNPMRTGYEFSDWYFDPMLAVPINELDSGLQPGRTYYAGWYPQKVYVRYYDTREGTGLISTQEMKYNDMILLLDGMVDTGGYGFARWTFDRAGTLPADINGTYVNADNLRDTYLVYYPTRTEENDVTGNLGGSHSTTDGYTGYWVLNLYADWDVKTVDYDVTINWDDLADMSGGAFLDNDGLRPQSVTIGLLSSDANGSTIGVLTLDGIDGNEADTDNGVERGSDEAVWRGIFENLPITVSDSSTENIVYKAYVISYVDVNGYQHDVYDVESSSGYLYVTTASNYDDSVFSAYDYTINNYLSTYSTVITCRHNLITTGDDLIFTIQWDDDSNRDGVRPGAVTLELYVNNERVDTNPGGIFHNSQTGVVSVQPGICAVSDDGNTWTYVFKDYQKYYKGSAIKYDIRMSNIAGYTITYTGGSANNVHSGAIVSHASAMESQTVNIHWDDESNRSNERPSSVDVNLYAYEYNSGTRQWERVLVGAQTVTGTGDDWSVDFDSSVYPLYKYSGGREIIYYAEVASDLNGRLSAGSTQYGWTSIECDITIYKATDIRDVVATVDWNDAGNHDGYRPMSVVVQLYADGKRVDGEDYHVTLSGDMTGNSWTYTFHGLPRFRDGDVGAEIVYSIRVEELVSGSIFEQYTVSYRAAGGVMTDTAVNSAFPYVMLTHDADKRDKTVTIYWDDESNRDDMRPGYVEVVLYAYEWNGGMYSWVRTVKGTVRMNSANIVDIDGDVWQYTFEDMDVYHDGYEIIYMAEVTSNLNAHVPVGGELYSWTAAELDITISQNLTVKDVPVIIEWDDGNNNDAIRPTTVIIQLWADGVKLEGEKHRVLHTGDMTEGTWKYTFKDMPVYREGEEGQEILYTITVDEAVEDSLYGYYIGYPNGYPQYVYFYSASYIAADGTMTSDETESSQPYVLLTHDINQGSVNISVSWHDDDNRDNVRPTAVLVTLYKTVHGEKTRLGEYNIWAGINGTWSELVSGLPLFEDGEAIVYSVDVSDDFRRQLEEDYGYTVTLENSQVHLSYSPKKGSVTGHINWSDNGDNDGIRPDAVLGELYMNGAATGLKYEFNESNGWTVTWDDLYVYYSDMGKTGTPVQYSIVVDAPYGYAASSVPEYVTIVEKQDIEIRLTHDNGLIDLPVQAFWNDGSDNAAKRPGSLLVQLYADGEPVQGRTLVLTGEGNIWTDTFEGLPKYDGGHEIYYTVEVADDVMNAYKVITAGMNVYLSRDTATGDLNVAFEFKDGNNADGARPTGLYVTLTADGVPMNSSEYVYTVQFNVDGIQITFTDLPVYSTAGKQISYNVKVTFDRQFGGLDYSYETSFDVKLTPGSSTRNRITVTLIRNSDTAVQTGHVYWFDNNNKYGQRPTSIDIDVHDDKGSVGRYTLDSVTGDVTDSDGNVVGSVTVAGWSDFDGSVVWTYTISGLPRRAVYDGVSRFITYKALLDSFGGLMSWYNITDNRGLDINLTHRNYYEDAPVSKQNFKVEISWLDNNNAWQLRPNDAGVKLDLLADGEVYKTVRLTKEHQSSGNVNLWAYEFVNLPTFIDGHPIVWTVVLGDTTGYTQNVEFHDAVSETITMFQSIGFDFRVNWNDMQDNDAVRPGSVTIDIYADGVKVDEVVLTGDGDIWTVAIDDMRVWRQLNGIEPVEYTFKLSDSTLEDMANRFYKASATKNGAAVETNAFYYFSGTTFGDVGDAGLSKPSMRYYVETTLTHDKETTTVFGEVVFDDADNQDGIRPGSVFVQLYADGEPVGEPIEVTGESNTWQFKFEDVDVYSGGKVIAYTVDIVEVPEGYDKTVKNEGNVITLHHEPVTTSVTGTVNWNDLSEIVRKYDSNGVLIDSYYRMTRVDVYVQLYADGEPYGEPVLIKADGYYGEGGSVAAYVRITWDELPVHRDEGEKVVYTFEVYSKALDEILADGHKLTYDFSSEYLPSATISHDLYDVRGTVYFLYNTGKDYLMKGVTVTAYLYDAETGLYVAVGSAVTDENGEFEMLNLPQGLLVVRATYKYGDYMYAGSVPVRLDRHDSDDVEIIINRDAQADSDLYRYVASGNAFYQTDRTDESTIRPVPEGSIVLLYRIDNGVSSASYAGMTTTDANGWYEFTGLENGSYIVNVVFNYEGGVYTYDNGDALSDGLTFNISGASMTWPDIIKQVNAVVEPGPGVKPNPEEPEPEPEDERTIVDGYVFYSENGYHTENPVSGVDVYVYLASNNVEAGHAMTDGDGHYVIKYLPAGEYIAVFSYEGNASRVLRFVISDAEYEAGSKRLATQYFDILQSSATATIRGVVLDENGMQTAALVEILDEKGNLLDYAYTDANGYYEFTVLAGYTYEVKILEVGVKETHFTVGDPDESHTTLDHYIISGNMTMDGYDKGGQMIAVYRLSGMSTRDLLLYTLTDDEGNYSFNLLEAGNYQLVYYINGSIYKTHNVTVGYQEYEPVVTETADGKYVISGGESYEMLTLYDVTTSAARNLGEYFDGDGYRFEVEPGNYMLRLVINNEEIFYHVDVPDNVVNVTYVVDIDGEVRDENGNVVLGSVVSIYDATGENKVRDDIVIRADGKYHFDNLPEGEYVVIISEPVAGEEMVESRKTSQPDSYGVAYPEGMDEGSSWTWNVNAVNVSGQVTDEDGKPIAGAVVILSDAEHPDRAYSTVTDADGKWFMGVSGGVYEAKAVYEINERHLYYSKNVETVTVGASHVDVTGVNLVIDMYDLTVSVIRSGDKAVLEGATVTITLDDGTVVYVGETDAAGRVTARVFADKGYEIYVEYADVSGRATVDVFGDVEKTVSVDFVITLSGIVHDVDGKPVADGIVYYDGPMSGSVFTGSDGSYVIVLTAKYVGTYRIYAAAAGLASDTVSVSVTTDTTKDLYLKSPTTGGVDRHVISGIVTDNEGNRLPNAVVTLMYGNDKQNTLTTSTDADGNYRFYVANGTYELGAAYVDGQGNTYTTNANTVVHVLDDDVVADLSVIMMYELTVTVVDGSGRPVSNAVVSYAGEGLLSGSRATGSNGTVKFVIAGGKYTFTARTIGLTSEAYAVSIPEMSELTIVLGDQGIKYEPPTVTYGDMAIHGDVLDSEGKPVEGAVVTLYQLKQTSVGELWVSADNYVTGADGHYVFRNLSNASYRVDVSYSKTFDGVMSSVKMYQVSGIAKDDDGNPYSNATVKLLMPNGLTTVTTVSGEDGYYAFYNLEAGSYTVEIVPAEDPQRAYTVTLEAQPSYAVIEGVVLDVNGNPVEGATVTIESEEQGKLTMTTGKSGEFRFDVNIDTEYDVRIDYVYSRQVEGDLYEPDEEDKLAPYVLADGFTFSGYVHNTDGEPVEGAKVTLYGVTEGVRSELEVKHTGPDGYYEFVNQEAGEYVIVVEWNGDRVEYPINAGSSGGDKPVEPEPTPGDKIVVEGVVVTDHGRPLGGAVVTVTHADSGETFTVTADKDGLFTTGELPVGRYVISAAYTHKYGTNESDTLDTTESRRVSLVICLYYDADVNGDGETERVFAGKDDQFDTSDDFYQADVANDGVIEDIFAGADGKPGTADDRYGYDVNHDGKDETVYVGEDRTPGTADDYYEVDVDKDGKNEKVRADGDGIPGTKDDFYAFDVDKDGKDETVYVGEDAKPGTSDDYYLFDVDDDGEADDKVFAGGDGVPGTKDDHYEEDGRDIVVGKDGKPNTPDDYYHDDDVDEDVFIGDDLKPGTGDDYYEHDVDKDGKPEHVRPGKDGRFGTEDDEYQFDVDGDGDDETVYVGPDGKPGTEDDYYEHDVDGDGEPERIEAGKDGVPGTDDDTYDYDVDGDGEDETVHVGPDGKPGTSDDWYDFDVDHDGEDERVDVGPDGKPGTPDDTYDYDADHDGEDETVHVGDDGIPGTEDDWYEKDVDGDGEDEKVHAGKDGTIGTEDDWYEKDVDGDGEDETVFVGPDGKPGTDDDWYDKDLDKDEDGDGDKENDPTRIGFIVIFDGNGGTVNGKDRFKAYSKLLGSLPSASRTNYTFDGWYTAASGGAKMTMANIRSLTKYTVLYAHWTYVNPNPGGGGTGGGNTPTDPKPSNPGGGGSGGGGGGTTTPTKYTVTFMSNGGSAVESQTVESGKTVTKPVDPTREGYKFDGWYTAMTGGEKFDFGTAVKSNLTLYARWTAITYKIDFDSNGGSAVESQNVEKGKPVTKPADPTRSGYRFLGWYVDGNVYDFSKPVTGELTLTARWARNVAASGLLNTDDHFAYVQGYGNGYVGPMNNITRAEVAQLFFNLLRPEIREQYRTTEHSFTDVPKGAWYEEAVATLANMGIVIGIGDNRFAPTAQITRGEFATICVRIGDLPESDEMPFTDVPEGYWARDFIASAYAEGWVIGVGGDRFAPYANMTRAEAFTLLNRVLGRDTITEEHMLEGMKTWPDNANKDAWYWAAVQEATNGHDYDFIDDKEVWIELT